MDESHFELEEVDGERRFLEVVVVCACRSGSCVVGRVVKEELDDDRSCLVISCYKEVKVRVRTRGRGRTKKNALGWY